ncbi:MAG: hypothetical protein NC187_01325 [Candidatus Amulumruptor caecigallinarius]|nr:hypothetical protein [Candidatus Amulumruptor caecigallinarius]
MKDLKISVTAIMQEIELPKQPGRAPNRMAQCNSADPSIKGRKRTESLVKSNKIRNSKKYML